ncbi:WXG100 family type VII secretion target, partial [Streptococcus agalactiae]
MAQIKLTPEELRASAQKYTAGSQQVTEVLNSLTQEQAVIDENWDGSAFDSFEAQYCASKESKALPSQFSSITACS